MWHEIQLWAFVNKRGAQLNVASKDAAGLSPSGEKLNPKQTVQLGRWKTLFGFEINFVRTVFERLQESPDEISDSELRAGVRVGEQVFNVLQENVIRRGRPSRQ
jgi:hypothetical protein